MAVLVVGVVVGEVVGVVLVVGEVVGAVLVVGTVLVVGEVVGVVLVVVVLVVVVLVVGEVVGEVVGAVLVVGEVVGAVLHGCWSGAGSWGGCWSGAGCWGGAGQLFSIFIFFIPLIPTLFLASLFTRFGLVLLDFYYFHSILSCPPWQHLYFSYTAFAVEPFFS